jgi:hydroxymethylbilane synthase
MTKTLRLGTRSSKLAMWQAYEIQRMLQAVGFEVEIITIETKGDKILDRTLSKIGSKGLFTEELEAALLEGRIDIVQHSAKDLPSTLPHGLELIAFTRREEACDVLVSANKNLTLNQEANFVLGTSSTRRVALVKRLYPNIKTVDMRGNLQTRFKKMEDGQADAMLLAYAGVHRMGLGQFIVQKLDTDLFVPAVGQGSIALECATNMLEDLKSEIRNACNDVLTERCILTERFFLKEMNGGCSIPVYGFAKISDESTIQLNGGILSLDGTEQQEETLKGTDPEHIGKTLAKNLLAKGADQILINIKTELNT